eukprot:549387-Rhodomonas_salina.1
MSLVVHRNARITTTRGGTPALTAGFAGPAIGIPVMVIAPSLMCAPRHPNCQRSNQRERYCL